MIKRHNLIYLSESARTQALNNLDNPNNDVKELVLNNEIPAIVSRQFECEDGFVQCGITSAELYDGNRLRIGLTVQKEKILRCVTPFEVLENSVCEVKKQVLEDLIKLGNENGLLVGFYGSLAMELITGKAYTNDNSDIDIYVKKSDKCSLESFYKGLIELEEKHKIKIDGEFEIYDVFGVKIKELFNSQKTVLAKGIDSVEIFEKSDVFDEIEK